MKNYLQDCKTTFLFFIVIVFLNSFVNAQKPSDLMDNCNQWKITYPTGEEDKTLCDEANNEFFHVNEVGDAIVFYAPIRSDNGTTPNSSNIRSELRERVPDGSVDIYWSTSGRHLVYVKQAITHLPINKPHLVATQIHGNKEEGIDDAMVVRLEDRHLFLSFNGGKLRSDLTIKPDYTLGTIHEVIFLVEDGKHYCYYAEDGNLLSAFTNDTAETYLIKDGNNDYVMDLNYDDSYFKIGNYTQSNADKEGDDTNDPENYGEVLVYDFFVEHGEVRVDGVSLSPASADLIVGKTQQLTATINPLGATNTEVNFTTSDSSIVQVDHQGLVTAISKGKAIITIATVDGNFKDTCEINVVDEAVGNNLALNKSISGTGTHDSNHEVLNLIDGSTDTRWSVSGFPQTATINLGAVYNVGRTELICYKDRDYQYTVSISATENGEYTQVVDRSENTTAGSSENPIIDTFSDINGQFVKITIVGATTYTGSWVSLMEFRVFGTENLSVAKENISSKLQLWPNPASTSVNIEYYSEFHTLSIYDNLGRLLIKQPIRDKAIDVSSLVSGMYVFKFSSKYKTVSRRLLKR